MAQEKQEIAKQLKEKILKTVRFIQAKLSPRSDVNQSLLDEYEETLKKFEKIEIEKFLEELRQIKNRPIPEGAETDYTEGISLEFEGEHKMLMEYLDEIEDLANKLR